MGVGSRWPRVLRRLSSRLDSIRKTACGDGCSRCLLCGAAFGPQGVSAVLCGQCKKVEAPWELLSHFLSLTNGGRNLLKMTLVFRYFLLMLKKFHLFVS